MYTRELQPLERRHAALAVSLQEEEDHGHVDASVELVEPAQALLRLALVRVDRRDEDEAEDVVGPGRAWQRHREVVRAGIAATGLCCAQAVSTSASSAPPRRAVCRTSPLGVVRREQRGNGRRPLGPLA